MTEIKEQALKMKNDFKSKKKLLKHLQQKIQECDYDKIVFWEEVKFEVYIMTPW